MSTKTIASTREAAADAILEAALKDPKVVFVSADSVKAARATKIAATIPERLFEVGIAEQTAVAFAAGLATPSASHRGIGFTNSADIVAGAGKKFTLRVWYTMP